MFETIPKEKERDNGSIRVMQENVMSGQDSSFGMVFAMWHFLEQQLHSGHDVEHQTPLTQRLPAVF